MDGDQLRPVPRMREVVREQLRIVALSLRREAVVIAALLLGLAFVMGVDAFQGRLHTWFDSSDDALGFAFAAFLLPFAVWRSERPFGHAFLWTLPVDRRRMALAKVFAGWAWLMAVLTAFLGLFAVAALLGGVERAHAVTLVPPLATTASYLLGSALVLGLRHPWRWLFAAAGAAFLLRNLLQALDGGPDSPRPILDAVGARVRGVASASEIAPHQAAAIAWLVVLGAAFLALWAALWRHRELRRS